MTIENDLIKLNEEIAGKRTRVRLLFDGADDLAGAEREQRVNAIKSATTELDGLINRQQSVQAEVNLNKLERDALKAMRAPGPRQISDDTAPSSSNKSPRLAGPDWGEAVLKANEEQSGGMTGLKALLPGGTAVVEVPIGGPIENPRRARFLSEIMPAEGAPGGHFSYLRQTVRDNNAAVVADGALKPTSVFTLEKIEDSTDVIAHLSESLPRHYFEDSENIRQFMEAEMHLGVDLAIDDKIVLDFLATPGILAEGDIGTTLDTCRRAITRLQEREVEPSAFVLAPRDWEQIELEMTAAFASNSNVPAPTDEVRRSLFGIPVVVSNAVSENGGLLGDFRTSAALYRTGGAQITWSEAASELFDYNLVKFRAETRVALAVYRPFAFCWINLAGTGS